MTTIVKDSYTLMLGDCLERMREIPDGSVDMVLADLPYGTTGCKWDIIIPFAPLWEQYWRVLKKDGAVVLFGSQPFTTVLGATCLDKLRYSLVWNKVKAGNFALGNKQFLKTHEDLLVFYIKQPTYNPQKIKLETPQTHSLRSSKWKNREDSAVGVSGLVKYGKNYEPDKKLPVSILNFSKDNYGKNRFHPTQKPVALLEYLIRTYTNHGELVLDNTMGSGSTGLAALQTGRRFVGVEKDPAYFAVAAERLSLAQSAGTTSGSTQSLADPDDSEPSAHDVSAVPDRTET